MFVPSKPSERNYDSPSTSLKTKGERSRILIPQLVCENASTNVECIQVPVSAEPLIAMPAENCAIEDPNILFDLILGGQCEIFSPDAGGIATIPQERKADLAEAAINDPFIPPALPQSSHGYSNTGRETVTFHRLLTSTEGMEEKRSASKKKGEREKMKDLQSRNRSEHLYQ